MPEKLMQTTPAVFAVGDTYQIVVETGVSALFCVQVGTKTYCDASNGIMNSLSAMHRVSVPMAALDEAKAYTVCIRPLVQRKPYFSITEDEKRYTFAFRPVPENNARAYHIADTHNMIAEPVRAAKAYGEVDFLILNGDVIDHSGSPDKFANIYQICEMITGGEVPVVFSRGNHDMRGEYAERFADYTPNRYGKTYYTFRLGSIWGVVLDCGEDKADDHPEYGFTVACHAFREEQTAFLQELVRHAADEYAAPGVKTRMVISHVPFTERDDPPFDIEDDVYHAWCGILREHVQPHIMLCGHTHRMEIREKGHARDHRGQPCSVVIGSDKDGCAWAGCGLCFGRDTVEAVFTNDRGERVAEGAIKKE